MIKNRARIAANGGTVTTSVLIYMALHDDDKLRFGKKRLDAITERVTGYSEDINHSAEKFIAYRDKLDACGIDFRLKRDFIRALQKGLKYTGKQENTGAEAGIEATYTLILWALHDLYGLGRERLRRIQQKIKDYAWYIRAGDVHVLEYMKCLACECGQQYQALTGYEKEHGAICIYGEE